MKRFALILILLLAVFMSQGQVVNGDKVNARLNFFLRSYRVDTIYNDTTGLLGRTKSLMTADAIYRFVNGRITTSASVDTLSLSNRIDAKADTATVWKIGGNYNINSITDFLGPIDNVPLRLKAGGNQIGVISGYNTAMVGGNNVGFGYQSLNVHGLTNGYNVGIGSQTLSQLTTAGNYVAIGQGAMQNMTNAGATSIAIGAGSLSLVTTSGVNIGIGNATLQRTTGSTNIAIGGLSQSFLEGGNNNVTIGFGTLYTSKVVSRSIAIGDSALNKAKTSDHIAIGYRALANFDTTTTIFGNVVVGTNAMTNTTTGSRSVAIGNNTLYTNTTGGINVAIGDASMYYNVDGTQNVGVGTNTLLNNTSGSKNLAAGAGALEFNTTGGFNIGLGPDALLNNTTGAGNIGIGWNGFANNFTGSNNIGIGYGSGKSITYGNYNIVMGRDAGWQAGQNDTITAAIILGWQSYATEDSVVVLGADLIKKTYLRGRLHANLYGSGVITGTPTYHLAVDASGNIIETPNPLTALVKATTTISNSQSTRILYDSLGILSNENNFRWNFSSNRLEVLGEYHMFDPSNNTRGIKIYHEGLGNKTYIQSFGTTNGLTIDGGTVGVDIATGPLNANVINGRYTAYPGTAILTPFKFTTSGAALNTTPVVGGMEVLVDSLFYTGAGGVRKRLAYADEISATNYVDSVSNNAAGDSLIVFKNSIRSAYKYPTSVGAGGGILSLGVSNYGLIIQNDSTYRVDTNLVSTRLWRQKGIDSVQANLTAGLALKFNLSDTASKTWDWADITGHPAFLTSYTETDPVYSGSSWFGTVNNSSNWNTAFGWGNHAGLYFNLSDTAAKTWDWADITGKPSVTTWDGGSTGLVAATGRSSLGGTTVGQNMFTLTNPSAITFPRFNADNTVSALDAASFRTAIGAGTGSGTLTDVTATNNTGQTWTITGTTTKNLSLVLTSAAVGLGSVENTALSTWAGSSNITTLGTIATGTWNGTAIGTSKGGTPTGGTTGQILVKNSATNYDYSWTTVSASGVTTIGTINGITKSANGLAISGANLHGQTVDATYPGMMTPTMLQDLYSNSYLKSDKRINFDSLLHQINDSTYGVKAIAVQINGTHLPGTLTDSTVLYNILSQMSITSDGSGFKLSGDASTPGNNMLYGTNGSGVKGWYAQPAGGAGLSDSDYGDITVTGTGTVMTIDNGVVTLAKMANLATGKVIGRTTAGTGVPEAVDAAIMNLTTPATGDHLEYNATTSEWENKIKIVATKVDITTAALDTLTLNDKLLVYDEVEAVNKKVKVGDLLHAYNRQFRRSSAYDYMNEFINTVTTTSPGAEVMATNSGTGAATATSTTTATNIVGIVRTTTGTTATGRSYVNAAAGSIRLGGATWVYEQYVNITTLSTGTERYAALFGFFDTYTAANQVDGAYLLYDEGGVSTGSTASANWQLVTVSNSTRTFTTTSTAIGAATWVKLRVEINAAGNRVDFFINDTNVGNHTANIPTAAGRETGFGWGMIKSAGTTARTMDTDYLMVVADYTTDK